MNVGSLFSGIGGFDLGLERAGHRIVFQCEKDPYRRRVLERHWPGVPCFEDVCSLGRRDIQRVGRLRKSDPTKCERDECDGAVDLVCGGFPCQDLSVAGQRAGLAGERSGLFFEFARVADALLTDGGWLLIENVPGLLSSQGGRDFAVLLSTLGELGFHDLAWRVLDSRYLGVPQRRRRVFILARRSQGRSASEVLLEPESGGGDFEAGAAERQGFADGAEGGIGKPLGAHRTWRQDLDHHTYVTWDALNHAASETVPTLGQNTGQATGRAGVISAPAHPNGVREAPGVSRRMDVGAFNWQSGGEVRHGYKLGEVDALHKGQTPAVDGNGSPTDRCVLDPKPDGPRYAACGDAVTVNVAHWIGLRLNEAPA